MPITISLDPARQDLDAIHRMLAGTYWSPGIRRDVVAEALRNSITAVAIDDASGATVGLARVVTDRATFAWLCDVFVDERFRGQGISKRLLEELERHPTLQTLRRWCLATRDAHGLYAKYGYQPVPEGRWMERQARRSAGRTAGADARPAQADLATPPVNEKARLEASRRALNSPSWTRTSNLAVNSRPLYRLSYRGMLGREGGS